MVSGDCDMVVGKMLNRKKTMAGVVRETSMLDRVLTTTDLTALGVGSTIGVGVYVLPGALSKYVAGPAVVLSFFFAAVASIFAGKYICNGVHPIHIYIYMCIYSTRIFL